MKLGRQIEIVGRVGSQPEIVNEIDNKKLIRFSVGIVNAIQGDGFSGQRTSWQVVNALNSTATEILKMRLRLGETVRVSGTELIDENTDILGNKKYVYEIVAQNVTVI
ncbi:MAG: single-stranded DNA-binding protein [Bacteroidales bacterium]|nr:single-stranded DNA-binding protein [Bacteroidales bacterium]